MRQNTTRTCPVLRRVAAFADFLPPCRRKPFIPLGIQTLDELLRHKSVGRSRQTQGLGYDLIYGGAHTMSVSQPVTIIEHSPRAVQCHPRGSVFIRVHLWFPTPPRAVQCLHVRVAPPSHPASPTAPPQARLFPTRLPLPPDRLRPLDDPPGRPGRATLHTPGDRRRSSLRQRRPPKPNQTSHPRSFSAHPPHPAARPRPRRPPSPWQPTTSTRAEAITLWLGASHRQTPNPYVRLPTRLSGSPCAQKESTRCLKAGPVLSGGERSRKSESDGNDTLPANPPMILSGVTRFPSHYRHTAHTKLSDI